MIHALYALLKRWRIVGVTPLDLINWYERKIDLCYHDERMNNGAISVWVSVQHPDHIDMDRDSKFYQELRAIMLKLPPGVLRESDIRDRFKSQGKLWLVLIGGKVVEESTVRVYSDKCLKCGKKPEDARERLLMTRQEMRCFACFCKTFEDEWPYASSTFTSTRRSHDHEASYDPVTGKINYRVLTRNTKVGKEN